MAAKKKNHPHSLSPKEIAHSYDPLEEVEDQDGFEMSGSAHDEAEKPIKLPKKVRSRASESYFPLHRK